MGLSITKKIISSHLIEGGMRGNEQITISVDQTLGEDVTSIIPAQLLESVGIDKVSTELSIFYCDHNTLVVSSDEADNHLYLKSVAERFGLYFSKPGNGICHSIHYQRFGKPGQVLLGADSHTPTSGALGMLAIGSGGLSVAMGMVGEGFKLTTPKILNVKLTGALQPGVSAKDIALEVLRILSVKGGVGSILEFTGEGVQCLSVPQRATLANMSIETGATTGIFPSDAITRRFLIAQDREQDWVELLPDADAAYDEVIEIDLDALEPLVAKPHMPDLVVKAREVGAVKVNSVFIGSCTNASFSDLAKAAKILQGKKVHQDIDLTMGAGSKQVLEQLIADGVLADLVASGARILENACGPCCGVGQVPCTRGTAVRTSNRNFMGRSGSKEALVYLASPETAAATALTGRITDPRDIMDVSLLKGCVEPDAYKIDDCLIISPADVADNRKVEIIRGENISTLPERGLLANTIRATCVLKLGDNITTDDIIPAGSNILKFNANIPKFAEYTFCYTDPTFVGRAKQLKKSIIIGGENYGQGSSREHAAMLPMFLGVQAVIVKSYARIHKENLINFGILPLLFENRDDYAKIDVNDVLEIDDVYSQTEAGKITVMISNRNLEFKTTLDVSDFDKRVLKAGGVLNYIRNKMSNQQTL